MRRIRPVVASAAHPESPAGDTWVSVALSFQGLKALGVPQTSLDSFPTEFQQGMAARAPILGDTGESSPEHWEKPLGSADVHVALTALAPDTERLEGRSREPARNTRRYPALPAFGASIVTFCRIKERPLDTGTGSVIPRWKVRVYPAAIPTKGPRRQFEFVQSEWMNDASFFGGGDAKDPVAGANTGDGVYSFPMRPIPKRMKGPSRFVVTRGGEYCFLPGLRALRWLGDLES